MVREGKHAGIAADGVAHTASARQLEHALGDIDGDGARSGVSLANHEGEIARAGGEIEHLVSGAGSRLPDERLFEGLLASGRCDDEIVERRQPVKPEGRHVVAGWFGCV